MCFSALRDIADESRRMSALSTEPARGIEACMHVVVMNIEGVDDVADRWDRAAVRYRGGGCGGWSRRTGVGRLAPSARAM